MTSYPFQVTVTAASFADAVRVMRERVLHDEDLGVDYTIDFDDLHPVAIAVETYAMPPGWGSGSTQWDGWVEGPYTWVVLQVPVSCLGDCDAEPSYINPQLPGRGYTQVVALTDDAPDLSYGCATLASLDQDERMAALADHRFCAHDRFPAPAEPIAPRDLNDPHRGSDTPA